MSEEANEKIKEILEDLVFLQGVIATELIQITENTSAAIRGGEVPEKCLEKHNQLRQRAVALVEKYQPAGGSELREHVIKH